MIDSSPAADPALARRKTLKDALRIAALVLFFCFIAVLLQHPYVRSELFDIATIRERLRGFGFYAYGIFIVAATIVNSLGVPRLWISVVAGSLYGAVQGTGVAMVATLLGASANFWMARKILRGPVLRRLPARLLPWLDRLRKRAFFTILYLRLFPFTNATLTNLLAGASNMRYTSFLGGTILGFIPFTVIFATFGSSAAKHNEIQLVLAAILLTMTSMVQWIFSRRKKQPANGLEDFTTEQSI